MKDEPWVNYEKPKINLTHPIYILIILCMGFFILWQIKSAKVANLERLAENSQWNAKLQAERAVSLDLAGQISTISQQAKERASKDSLVISRKSSQIKTMTKTLAVMRVPVEQLADTIQPLRDYLVLADSLSAAKDSLILDMGLRHSAQIIDLNQIINLQAQQIVSEKAVSELLENRVAELEKDVKKANRGKTILKVLAGGALAWGIWESLKD